MSKYQLCKSKLHRPLEKWNLNFHFRHMKKVEICSEFDLKMCYDDTTNILADCKAYVAEQSGIGL